MSATEKTQYSHHHCPHTAQQSVPLNSTTDTFHMKEGCPDRGAYKTFIGSRSMAAGLCVYVRLSIFIKGRETSKGDRVSHLCEVSEGGGGRESCVNASQKPTRIKRFGGVLWPL